MKKKTRILDNLETAAFCRQMATVLGAGISAYEGIVLLMEGSDSQQEKDILVNILQALQEGASFTQALRITGVFPEYMVAMCGVGEETGQLDEVMAQLRDYYEQKEATMKAWRNAIIYPAIMCGLILVVVIVLLTQVMPIFQQVFAQLGLDMTGLSLGFLQLGNVLMTYGWILGGILILMVILLVGMYQTGPGRLLRIRLAYILHPGNNRFQRTAFHSFVSTMSIALRSGLSISHGIKLCIPLIRNPYFIEQLHRCEEGVCQGDGLSEVMIQQHMISGLSARMLALAEKTGNMDEVLSDIAVECHNDMLSRENRRISMIEPIVIVALSLIIGGILIAVMLPLLNILSGMSL